MKLLLFLLIPLTVISVYGTETPCQSCQSMVQSFVDASTNHAKMVQFKLAILTMCQGTWHQSDCEKTVQKLDLIATKLAPYLADTFKLCSSMGMCSDSLFSNLSRFLILFFEKAQSDLLNNHQDTALEECKTTLDKTRDLVINQESLAKIQEFSKNFCASQNPTNHHKLCTNLSSILIQDLFTALHRFFDSSAMICDKMFTRFTPFTQPPKPTKSLRQVWSTLRDEKGEELMSCFECTLSVDALIEEFINKRQSTADDLQKVICAKVNADWTTGCDDFLQMYLSTFLYLTYNQFDGRGICTMVHTCEKKEVMDTFGAQNRQLGCNSCSSIESFLAANAAHLYQHTSNAIHTNICQNLPVSISPLCTVLGDTVAQTVFSDLGNLSESKAFCPLMCP